MKKTIFSSLIAMLLALNSFAGTNPALDTKILDQFHQDFNYATNVTWSVKNDFVKISFNVNDEALCAFYKFDGKLIGTSRVVNVEKLPAKVRSTIANKYAGYAINEVIELTTPEDTSYYISVSNEKKKVILQSAYDFVSLYKKL